MKKTVCRFILLSVVVLVASCSPKNEYVNALPKDAAVVVSIDLKSMAEKSGLNDKEGEKVVSRLTEALKSGLEGEAGKAAERIVRNPSESGLSLTDHVYMFVTPRAHACGILAKVEGESKVKDLMKALKSEQICTELHSENGCTWTEMGNALCMFNGNTFLLMRNDKGKATDLKETMLALMRQDKTSGFAGTSDFAQMEGAQGDLVAAMNMSFMSNDITMQMRMGMPAHFKLEDMKYLLTATFEKGKIAIVTRSLTENKDLIAMYGQQQAVWRPIKGTYMQCFPVNTMCWLNANIDGEGVYRLLCENPTIKQVLEKPTLPVDFGKIFASLHGDIALGFSPLASNDLLMYADVTHKDFLQSFEDLRPLLALTGGQMQLLPTGQDQYEFRAYGQSIWFGVKNNLFYLSNNRRLAEEAGRTYGASLQNAPWAGEVTQNRFYAVFNVAQFLKDIRENPVMAQKMGADEAASLNLLLGTCDYINVMLPDWKNAQINIVMKDKETNVLKSIMRGLENL